VELDQVVQLLKDNPTIRVQIGGHTDNVGKPVENLKLSNDRARSVTNYLISKGIDAKRLVAKGFGDTVPVADNSSDIGRAKNRRTELKILGN
jgi:outer membrane protein OmpA-like peptidoglycan-associated protein